jgi:hypothetical protein
MWGDARARRRASASSQPIYKVRAEKRVKREGEKSQREGGRHDEETGTNIEVDDGLGHCRGRIDDGSGKEKGD